MDHVDVIRREGSAFYDTADAADPAAPVPWCPGWAVVDLVWHLAEVHWFWGTIVDLRLAAPDTAEGHTPPRPGGYADVVALGRSSLDRMLGALENVDDATPVWTWADRKDVGFIRRHQVQETAVHRWDLQRAVGAAADPIDAAAAADAVDEFLEVSLPWSVHPDSPLPGTVHLHCTDAAGEWIVHEDGRVERTHAKGDVALRGTASDLLLALYKRVGPEALDVVGDESLGRHLLDRIDVG